MTPFEPIVATLSVSAKGREGSEDRVRTFAAPDGSTGVVVCDGVGSIPGSGGMAEEVSGRAAALLGNRGVKRGVWELDELLGRTLPVGRRGATTLVVLGAHGGGLVGHLLVGNGSVIEVVPVESEGEKRQLLWTSIVLPQIGEAGGRLALRSVLPPPNGQIEAEKGLRVVPPGTPRLYLACSDGLLSEEDRAEGAAPDGTAWRQVPAGIARVLEHLAGTWPALQAASQAEAALLLGELLRQALDDPDLLHRIGDDTSVGALMMRPCTPSARGTGVSA
jgi:hypothetical protein